MKPEEFREEIRNNDRIVSEEHKNGTESYKEFAVFIKNNNCKIKK